MLSYPIWHLIPNKTYITKSGLRTENKSYIYTKEKYEFEQMKTNLIPKQCIQFDSIENTQHYILFIKITFKKMKKKEKKKKRER